MDEINEMVDRLNDGKDVHKDPESPIGENPEFLALQKRLTRAQRKLMKKRKYCIVTR